MEELRFYASRKRAVKNILIAVCMLVLVFFGTVRLVIQTWAGIHVIQNSVWFVIEFFTTIFMIWLFIHSLFDLVWPRPYITLTPQGIVQRGAPYKIIPWKYLGNVYIESNSMEFPRIPPKPQRIEYVFVDIKDMAGFLKEVPMPWFTRKLWEKSSKKRILLTGAGMLAVTREELKQRIETYRADHHV